MTSTSPAADELSALEAGTIRKISRRIAPFIIVLYFVSFLNRVNVGFAALTMNHDIGRRTWRCSASARAAGSHC
jgi:ACS family tartrate transporter-like MFS transporter